LLGHLTRLNKTYHVFGGLLNLAQSINPISQWQKWWQHKH